jgi:hypothetical protein
MQIRSKGDKQVEDLNFSFHPQLTAFIRVREKRFKVLKGYSNADKNRCTQMRSKAEKAD